MRQILDGAKGNGFEILLTAGVVPKERGWWFVSVNKDQKELVNVRERSFTLFNEARRSFRLELIARGVSYQNTGSL